MYAQKNYLQVQGISGKFRIDQIGCFLVTICNWRERKGRGISPVDLNAQFVNNGTYIDIDDGIRDDLGPFAFHASDGLSNCSPFMGGAPDTDDAIVEFQYTGKSGFTTHYCLVVDHVNGIILDSYDGVLKSWSVYGGPHRFARLGEEVPAPVTVTARPPAVKYQVVETYEGGKQIKLNKQPTHLWGMNYDLAYMVEHPVETHNVDETWTVVNKVRHENGGEYYRREGQQDGFNVVDCDDYTPPQPQLEVVDTNAAPPVTDVSNPLPTGESEEQIIPVTVVKKLAPVYTPFPNGPKRVTAIKSLVVQEINDTTIQAQLVKGQPVVIAGTFPLDGVGYYRTAKSVEKGIFVPIPVDAVRSQSYSEDDDQAIGQVLEEMSRESAAKIVKTRDQSVHKLGTFFGNIERKLHLKK